MSRQNGCAGAQLQAAAWARVAVKSSGQGKLMPHRIAAWIFSESRLLLWGDTWEKGLISV